jgi:tetratricopeptide (TPR) repeat protein
MKKNLLLFSVLLAFFACNNTKPKEEVKSEEVKTPVTVSEVINRISDSIALDSTNAVLYRHRAEAYLNNEQVGAAMMDINKSLQLDPNDIDTYLLLANVYYLLGDESNISATLNKAAEIDPLDTRPMVKLGELNLLQQNYNLSAAYIDKALKIQPFNPKAYFVKGMYFIIAQQDTVNALKNFQISSEQDETFYDPAEQICRIYAVQQLPYALDYIRKTQRQFPEQANSRYELALYLQSHGEPEEALAHYDTLLMQQPENYIVLYNIAYVNFVYLERNDVALEYFNRVLDVNPDYLDAYFNKGRVLEQMGDYAQAVDIYKEVLNRKPNYQLAIDGINRIQNQVDE